MSSTLIPTCSACGLRFASRPLLELHVREDHRQHDQAGPGPGRGGPAGAAAAPPDAGARARSHPRASAPPSAAREMITMASAQQPRRQLRPGRAMTALRGLGRTLRHVNDQLLLASELMFRPPRAPLSRDSTAAAAHARITAGQAGQAGQADRAA